MPHSSTTFILARQLRLQETRQPRLHAANMVVLKGKRASIGKTDLAERNASRCARQVDSVAAHRTMDKSDHYARDTVGITKPPDTTWWPLVIIAVLALVAAARYIFKSN